MRWKILDWRRIPTGTNKEAHSGDGWHVLMTHSMPGSSKCACEAMQSSHHLLGVCAGIPLTKGPGQRDKVTLQV